jgi:hypothetical protein
MYLLLAFVILLDVANAFQQLRPSSTYRNQLVSRAKKFDSEDFIKVSISKPLGLDLEEVEENAARGVTVAAVNEGNAKANGKVYKGTIPVSTVTVLHSLVILRCLIKIICGTIQDFSLSQSTEKMSRRRISIAFWTRFAVRQRTNP